MAVPDQTPACAGPLGAARAAIEQQLAQARAVMAAHGLVPPSAADAPTPRPAEFRVFRHPQMGVHFVVRDRSEVLGYVCVFGPKDASGAAVTFAEALAFANQAFLVWAQEHLLGGQATLRSAASLTAVEGEAKRLTALYAAPTGGREA